MATGGFLNLNDLPKLDARLDPGTLWMIYLKGRRMCLGMIAEDSTRNYYSKSLAVS